MEPGFYPLNSQRSPTAHDREAVKNPRLKFEPQFVAVPPQDQKPSCPKFQRFRTASDRGAVRQSSLGFQPQIPRESPPPATAKRSGNPAWGFNPRFVAVHPHDMAPQ